MRSVASFRKHFRAEAEFERVMTRLADEIGAASRALHESQILGGLDYEANRAWFEDVSRRIDTVKADRLACLLKREA